MSRADPADVARLRELFRAAGLPDEPAPFVFDDDGPEPRNGSSGPEADGSEPGADTPPTGAPGPRLWTPIADLPRDDPPPLLADRLVPEEHTVLFGPGGVGKGVVAVDLIVSLAAAGLRTLVVDYESHPREWSRRLWSLGGADAVDAVAYIDPTRRLGPGDLARHAPALRAIADETGTALVVIDSISAACGGDPLEASVPWRYQLAVMSLRRTVLSLAHVTKVHAMAYPFGSVMWHNAARMTWSLERLTEAGALKLRCRKSNDYGTQPDALVELLWHDGRLRSVTYQDYNASVAERIAELLADGSARSQADIRLALAAEDDEPLNEATVRSALRRHTGPGLRFTARKTARGPVYSLRQGR